MPQLYSYIPIFLYYTYTVHILPAFYVPRQFYLTLSAGYLTIYFLLSQDIAAFEYSISHFQFLFLQETEIFLLETIP